MAVLRNTGKAGWSTKWAGVPDRVDPEKFEDWTAGQMRQCLEAIAADCQLSLKRVLDDVRWRLTGIVKLKEGHDMYRQELRAVKVYRALLPSGSDAELEIRNAAHFDRDWARNLKWLEEAQRPRNSDLPASIRIDIG